MTGATSGARIAYPSGAPDFTPVSSVGFVFLDLLFYLYALQIVVCSVGYCVVCPSIYGF